MGSDFISDIPGSWVAKLGSHAAIASNGAGAILDDTVFYAPFNLQVLSFIRRPHGADEVTKGTATTSASYRRHNLINGGAGGAGTTIMASLNNTASLASRATRAGATTGNNTLAAGHQMFVSHLTVGAETADGTDAAAASYHVVYGRL